MDSKNRFGGAATVCAKQPRRAERWIGLTELSRHPEIKHVDDLLKLFSADEVGVTQSRRFLVDVDSTLESLQQQEDTDNNMQITIEDEGPKVSLYIHHLLALDMGLPLTLPL